MATISKNPRAASAPEDLDEEPPPSQDERRSHHRFDVEWAVDCVADDTFLYASITNISAMGIFVKTTDPLAIGTSLMLTFEPPGYEPFKLEAEGAWDHPGSCERRQSEPGDGRALHHPPTGRARASRRGDSHDRVRARALVERDP